MKIVKMIEEEILQASSRMISKVQRTILYCKSILHELIITF